MKRTDQATIIFRLPPETKKELQIKVLEEGTSVQELLEGFVNDYLKEENKMRTWQRKGYTVEERAHDYDLHCFAVVQDGQEDQIIYPATIEDMQAIIADLDNGDDVDGWEDGMGNTISIVTMSHEELEKAL